MGQLPVVQQTRLLRQPPLLVSRLWHIRSSRGGDVTIERSGRNAKPVRDLRHADVGVGEHRLSGLDVVVRQLRRTASGAANAPRGGKSCLGALSDQAALEFRQCAEHVKNEPPLRGRRVEGFGQAAKPDISQPQFLDCFDQLLHRPRQAVELPHNQRVAAPREFERVVKGWAIRDRARHLLGENLPASRLGQRVPLQGKILVNGRNPRVADQHALRMDFPVRPWRQFCLRAFPSGGASSSLPQRNSGVLPVFSSALGDLSKLSHTMIF